jgi:hypothetical protein
MSTVGNRRVVLETHFLHDTLVLKHSAKSIADRVRTEIKRLGRWEVEKQNERN